MELPKQYNLKLKIQGGFLGALLAPLAASVVQPVIYSVIKGITERGVMRGIIMTWINIFTFASLGNVKITKYFK